MSWAYEKCGSRYQLRQITGIRSTLHGDMSDEALAIRVVTLLDRHGLEDVLLPDPDSETA